MLHLIEIYGKSGRDDLFFKHAERIVENSKMRDPFMVSLSGMLQEHPEREEKISLWLSKQNGIASKKQLSPEMTQLVEALKVNIQVLINEGKTAEAKQLLEELKKIV